MTEDRYVLLGKYLCSLPEKQQSYAQGRMHHIIQFLESDCEITRKGFKEFLKKDPENGIEKKRGWLLDFFYFCGVRFGKKRSEKASVLEKNIATVALRIIKKK